MNRFLRVSFLTLISSAVFLSNTAAGMPVQQGTAPAQPTATSKKTGKTSAPTAQQISDAKAKGMVWVNTSTHVYHKDSSSLYGATKHGKFMSEDDAKKAGYRAANESGAAKK